jgi:hypothetical protein
MPKPNDMSRCLAALQQDSTLIAVIDNASSYCAPFYVVKTPIGQDSMLADGAGRSPIDPKQQELTL